MCSVKVAGGLDGIDRGYTPPPCGTGRSTCAGGGIGRRARLRAFGLMARGGSSPLRRMGKAPQMAGLSVRRAAARERTHTEPRTPTQASTRHPHVCDAPRIRASVTALAWCDESVAHGRVGSTGRGLPGATADATTRSRRPRRGLPAQRRRSGRAVARPRVDVARRHGGYGRRGRRHPSASALHVARAPRHHRRVRRRGDRRRRDPGLRAPGHRRRPGDARCRPLPVAARAARHRRGDRLRRRPGLARALLDRPRAAPPAAARRLRHRRAHPRARTGDRPHRPDQRRRAQAGRAAHRLAPRRRRVARRCAAVRRSHDPPGKLADRHVDRAGQGRPDRLGRRAKAGARRGGRR